MGETSFELAADLEVGSHARARTRDVAANAAMDRYASGDDAAFSELYDAIASRLYAFLLRQVRSSTQAEDLLQQAMMQIHCARASYVAGAEVVPWAFAIARNLVIDGHRKRRNEVSFDGDDTASERPSLEPSPDDMLQSKQAARAIERVLASLPESQRAAFELLKYDGLTLVEAAEVLGTTVGAVKVRAHRTYEALRAALRE